MTEDTPHSTILWCEDQDEKIKALQDFCLDHPLDREAKGILKRLTEIQEMLDSLSNNCHKQLFVS